MTQKEYISNIKKTAKQLKKLNITKLDTNVDELKKAFDIAYENKLFQLYHFEKNTQDFLKLKLFSKLTRISGSLSFLGIQILAANSIMNKNSFVKSEEYFAKKSGIAINHLRAAKTYVSAKECENGYTLDGALTWASGYKIFDTLLIGFHYDGKEYEVMAKFEETDGFTIMDTPQTFVAQSLNTVNIKLENFFVKEENIVSSNKIGNYTKNKSLSKTIHYTLYGLGKGALKAIENPEFKKISKQRLNDLKKSILKTKNGEELDYLRMELFKTVQDMITTAMITYGGKSILLEKDLQRYYRELIMFNSNGLNTTIKDIFLVDCLAN